jgi:hypothetical protein
MMKMIGAFVLAAFLVPLNVHANDGFAALGAGGVTISRSDMVALKREVLDISCDEIHVSYDFVNESGRDEEALVMFPLPPYPADFSESNVISHGQPSGFTIKVDGRIVTYDTEVKATHKGRDVTEALKAAGLTPQQIARLPFDKTLLNFDHELLIPKEQRDALAKKGLVVDGVPAWNIHVTYVWKQTFPANTTVHVEHMYRPFTAEGTFGGYPGHTKLGDYCLTEEQVHRLKDLRANKEKLNIFSQVPGTNLKYILTTANSWKDGIRDFRLRIHVKAEDEIVGLCFPAEVKRVSATTYEAHMVNFKPTAELSVFFGNAKKCGSNGYGEPPAFR